MSMQSFFAWLLAPVAMLFRGDRQSRRTEEIEPDDRMKPSVLDAPSESEDEDGRSAARKLTTSPSRKFSLALWSSCGDIPCLNHRRSHCSSCSNLTATPGRQVQRGQGRGRSSSPGGKGHDKRRSHLGEDHSRQSVGKPDGPGRQILRSNRTNRSANESPLPSSKKVGLPCASPLPLPSSTVTMAKRWARRHARGGVALPPPSAGQVAVPAGILSSQPKAAEEGGVGVPEGVAAQVGGKVAAPEVAAPTLGGFKFLQKPQPKPGGMLGGAFAAKPGMPPPPGCGGGFAFSLPPPLPKEEESDYSSSDDGSEGLCEFIDPKPPPPVGVPPVSMLNAGVMAALARSAASRELRGSKDSARRRDKKRRDSGRETCESARNSARVSARADCEPTRDRPTRQTSQKNLHVRPSPTGTPAHAPQSELPVQRPSRTSDLRNVVSL